MKCCACSFLILAAVIAGTVLLIYLNMDQIISFVSRLGFNL